MKITNFAVVILTILILIGTAAMSSAEGIPVNNADFEDLAVVDGSYVAGSIPDWGIGGIAGTYDPVAGSPDGVENNIAYINSNRIGQWLNIAIEEGATYEFKVQAASAAAGSTFGVYFIVRDDFGAGDYIPGSHEGITGSTAAGSFQEIIYSTTFGSEFWGKELGIWLALEGGSQVWFDDVEVNKYSASAPLPEPFSIFINEKTKVEYKFKDTEKDDKLEIKWYFKLGAESVVDPLTEDLHFAVGDINFSIPAGSFQLDELGTEYFIDNTCVVFNSLYPTGTCDERKNKAKIKQENGYYKVEVKIEKCSLPDVGTAVTPLHIELLIGNDIGDSDLDLVEDNGKVEFKGEKPQP